MILLAVFRSRTQSLDYAGRLNEYGVSASTVATPKEARIGCGLCVKFDGRYYARAKAVLKTGNYTTFKGFYKLDFHGGGTSVLPYYENKE